MFSFDLDVVSLNYPTEQLKDSDTHVSISLNHSGHIAGTTMSVRLQQVRVHFHVFIGT